MKKNIIFLFFLLFIIAKANSQEIDSSIRDTIFYSYRGCQGMLIQNKYTIDTLYTEIVEPLEVRIICAKTFERDTAFFTPDNVLFDCVKIYPIGFDIKYLNTNKEEFIAAAAIPEEYNSILLSITEMTLAKSRGEILHTKGFDCYNYCQGIMTFYVFPYNTNNAVETKKQNK